MEEKNMNPAAQLLDDAALSDVSGGGTGGEEWGKAYFAAGSKLHTIRWDAPNQDDRELIDFLRQKLIDAYMDSSYLPKLISETEAAPWHVQDTREKVLEVLRGMTPYMYK